MWILVAVVARAEPLPAVVQQALAERVIASKGVAGFLHPEVPGNLPLAVWTTPALADGAPGLVVGGQPVRVSPSEADARLILRSVEPRAAGVRVLWEVPKEGASGWVDLVERRDNVWTVTDAAAVER